jgi:hypothetical protein
MTKASTSLLVILSLLTALATARLFPLGLDLAFPSMDHQILDARLMFLLHISAASVALACGALQIIPAVRKTLSRRSPLGGSALRSCRFTCQLFRFFDRFSDRGHHRHLWLRVAGRDLAHCDGTGRSSGPYASDSSTSAVDDLFVRIDLCCCIPALAVGHLHVRVGDAIRTGVPVFGVVVLGAQSGICIMVCWPLVTTTPMRVKSSGFSPKRPFITNAASRAMGSLLSFRASWPSGRSQRYNVRTPS